MEHGVGDAFLVVGELYDSVCLYLVGEGEVVLVQRAARGVEFRHDI